MGTRRTHHVDSAKLISDDVPTYSDELPVVRWGAEASLPTADEGDVFADEVTCPDLYVDRIARSR